MQAQKIKKGTGLQKHLRDARRSINQFRKTPFFSLITVLIVMLTLVFPSLSVTAVLSLKSLVDLFSDEIELIAYVNTELSDEAALGISERLQINKNISTAELTTRDAALREFSTTPGLGEIALQLPNNPLPASITVTPAIKTAEIIEQLTIELKNTPGIQTVDSDLLWSDRVKSWYQALQIFSLIVSVLSLAALAAILGFMAYTEVNKRREELQIIHVIGGNVFDMMRPLLYKGFFLGFAAGALAYILHIYILHLIESQITVFYELYELTPILFDATALHLRSANPAILIITATFLSWATSFIGAFVFIRRVIRN